MNALFQKSNECSYGARRFKSLLSITLFTSTTITIMGIQDKNTKNSIKSENYPKSKTLRELENLIDWYIVIKPSVQCSGLKSTSEKMSVDKTNLHN